jgi:hypothetical protein
MDIVVWLRSLGLAKYEAAFVENKIDETVLPNLTAEDLKELGVTALGHRRKLLDAIAYYDGSVGGLGKKGLPRRGRVNHSEGCPKPRQQPRAGRGAL